MNIHAYIYINISIYIWYKQTYAQRALMLLISFQDFFRLLIDSNGIFATRRAENAEKLRADTTTRVNNKNCMLKAHLGIPKSHTKSASQLLLTSLPQSQRSAVVVVVVLVLVNIAAEAAQLSPLSRQKSVNENPFGRVFQLIYFWLISFVCYFSARHLLYPHVPTPIKAKTKTISYHSRT